MALSVAPCSMSGAFSAASRFDTTICDEFCGPVGLVWAAVCGPVVRRRPTWIRPSPADQPLATTGEHHARRETQAQNARLCPQALVYSLAQCTVYSTVWTLVTCALRSACEYSPHNPFTTLTLKESLP